jgi:hypothetical protein
MFLSITNSFKVIEHNWEERESHEEANLPSTVSFFYLILPLPIRTISKFVARPFCEVKMFNETLIFFTLMCLLVGE